VCSSWQVPCDYISSTLEGLPKGCEAQILKLIVVREEMIELLAELWVFFCRINKAKTESQDFDLVYQSTKLWPIRGLYLDGPVGIGKSIVVYFLVCCLRAMGWIVPFIVRHLCFYLLPNQ
jgi:predicted ATPase